MIKHIIQFFIITILLIGCNNKNIITEEVGENPLLHSGEWFSSSDSLSGISIRKNKIGFYKNNKLITGDICDYVIVDSILYNGQKQIILSTYLKFNCYTDTIFYKIEKRNNSALTLTFPDKRNETFTLKQN